MTNENQVQENVVSPSGNTDNTHRATEATTPSETEREDTLFVVGIGASAGGLDALERFFQKVPTDTGAAFVVVQHLSPDFKSLMAELLARHTELDIYRVEDSMPLQANSIYLIPPAKTWYSVRGNCA